MNKATELENWQEKYGFKHPKKMLNIYYTSLALAKTIMLVNVHPEEVGWNMIIKPYKDGYRIEDIVVYPQKVTAAHVSVDVPRYGMWKASLDDNVEANLFGNGHSHVNMSTSASIIDENQQHDEILTKKSGFFFFQIWNKRNEINSFFYDIDNKIYYTVENIDIIVEDAESFIAESFRLVQEKRDWSNNFEVGEGFES